MIAQIDVANGGEVRFQSEVSPINDPKALSPGLSCRIGYVTQEDNLLPWRTTLQNVLFPLEVQGRLDAAGARARRHADPRRRPWRLRAIIIRMNCPAACASAPR